MDTKIKISCTTNKHSHQNYKDSITALARWLSWLCLITSQGVYRRQSISYRCFPLSPPFSKNKQKPILEWRIKNTIAFTIV